MSQTQPCANLGTWILFICLDLKDQFKNLRFSWRYGIIKQVTLFFFSPVGAHAKAKSKAVPLIM